MSERHYRIFRRFNRLQKTTMEDIRQRISDKINEQFPWYWIAKIFGKCIVGLSLFYLTYLAIDYLGLLSRLRRVSLLDLNRFVPSDFAYQILDLLGRLMLWNLEQHVTWVELLIHL